MPESALRHADEPPADQGDVHAACDADLRSIGFGDVHEHGADQAADEGQEKYVHAVHPVVINGWTIGAATPS